MQSPFLSPFFSSLLGGYQISDEFPYIFYLFFVRYIVLVLFRCYQKLWSGKRFTSAASQTEPELTFKKEEDLLCKTSLKHQPGQVELPEIPEKQCTKEEEPLSRSKNEDSSIQVGKVPILPKQLPALESSPSPASASNKQDSGSNNTGDETCAEYKQPDKVNGTGDRLLQDTPIKNSELCYTKSDIEDDIVLMKLKNESQVHDRRE